MLRELEIEGFRCFKTLRVAPLGRVNLIVGMNNSGKTALLDAIEILVSESPTPYVGGLVRRQETSYMLSENPATGTLTEHHLAAVAHLFHGHTASASSQFSIGSEKLSEDPSEHMLRIGIDQVQEHRMPSGKVLRTKNLGQLITEESLGTLRPGQMVIWSKREGSSARALPLLPDGTLGYSPVARVSEGKTPIQFLSTAQPDVLSLSRLFDQIMLTDDEGLVISALRIIEPRVERLAFRGEGPNRNIVVKLAGERGNLLLGSLGDGMRHLLALALHLVPARGGYLLVDEIDTGLHHSVMTKMWKLVIETARRLDIQVFATTHSADCITALADVHQQLKFTPDDVMLHRTVAGKEQTVAVPPEQIAGAVEYRVEVR